MTTLTKIRIRNLNFLRKFGLNPHHWVESKINTSTEYMTLCLQNIEDPSMMIEALLQKNANELTLSSLTWII
jgi:hypothetical protein